MEKRAYEYWLAGYEPLASQERIRLHRKAETEEMLFELITEQERNPEGALFKQSQLQKLQDTLKKANLMEEYEKFLETGIRMCCYYDEEYPEKLYHLKNPPFALFYKGKLPERKEPCAAIVGSRNCTRYGERYSYEFARALAENGVAVISGLARGIDGTAHRGALDGGGITYAVLGCGVDQCYPQDNIGIYSDILDHGGGILSEYPPDTRPFGFHFPMRNRIISALSDHVLVMEAKLRSGSLITADMALELGRNVFALPGGIDQETSAGTNNLIYQGAQILLSPSQLLQDIGIDEFSTEESSAYGNKQQKNLESIEKVVYSSLCLYPKSVDQIITETGFPARQVLSILISLQVKGYTKEISKNFYVRG